MKQTLTQVQQQRLQQTISLQQMQLSELLELPVSDLAQRVQNEILDNPALEGEAPKENEYVYDDVVTDDYADNDSRRVRRSNEDFDGDYSFIADESGSGISLHEQINELSLGEEESFILHYLADSLSEDGFLVRDDNVSPKDDQAICDELAVNEYIYVEADVVHHLVATLQQLEPAGIGAHTLQESLQLQLRRIDETPARQLAQRVLDCCYADFMQNRWERIATRLQAEPVALREAEMELRRLNPRPGAILRSSDAAAAATIIPDFFVEVDEGEQLHVSLNQGEVPDLCISESFIETAQQRPEEGNRQQQEAYIYAREKVEAAQSFINNIRLRQQRLRHTMETICQKQRDFFLNEDDDMLLQPMTLQDVAEVVGSDVSTISRVARSKYVKTRYGQYPLKFFFHSQTTTKDGEEISTRLLKEALREIVEAEDKAHPLSDEALATALNDKGYSIARRTVVKYRQQLDIPAMAQRRRL